jgi:Calcineurin-like phosphoesterase
MSRLPRQLTLLVVFVSLSLMMASGLAWAWPGSAPATPTGATLVATGADWHYLDDGSDQGTAWRALGFDGSGWKSGPAQLGYGDGDEATVVSFGPDANAKFITTYFRHTFDVTDATVYDGLTLNVLRDDGAVVYLNGTEVFRSNMPDGAIGYTTPASTAIGGADESVYHSAALDASLLVNGTNELAVEIHQANPTSSDISFDLSLIGSEAPATCAAPDVRFAVVGDYGTASQAEQDVAEMVQSWNPDVVITTGDNNYPDGSADTIDEHIGQFYQSFIGDYAGAYGAGAASNNFYPALGNHDWVTNSGDPPQPVPYLDYFSLPGNERYYSFTRGPVEFFAVDSDPNEPDGIAVDSIQATWLQGALAASTAPWRVVYMHHPPYSSGPHGSTAEMQWPYAQWGASAVLAGHDHAYERLVEGGLSYFVDGLGGASRYSFGTPVAGSQFRYADDYGALLAEASETCLNFQFIARGGGVIDSVVLGKEAVYLPLVAGP